MKNQKIGALWVRKSQDGKSFLSGVLNDLSGDIQIAVFKNDRKESENQPDYNIIRSEKREQKQNRPDDFLDEPVGEESSVINDSEIKVEEIPFG